MTKLKEVVNLEFYPGNSPDIAYRVTSLTNRLAPEAKSYISRKSAEALLLDAKSSRGQLTVNVK
jgi:hypothetical protein